MEGDVVGARLGVRRRPPVGVVDHQMAVHRDVGPLEQALHHRQPDGQVRHEVVVHHVDMHPVGAVHGRRLVGRAGRSRRPGSTARSAGRCTWRSPYFAGRPRTSRRCRAGAARAARTARRRDRRRRSNSGRVSSAVTGWRRSASATTPDRLGQVRRAGRVQHHSARPGQPDRRGQQLALQLGQRRAHRRAGGATAPPACAAAHRARCTARRPAPGRIPVRAPGSRPSTRSTSTGRPRVFSSTRSARRGGRLDRGDAAHRPASRSRPAARSCRPGPAHRSSQRPPSGPSSAASVSARATSWLPSSCTSAAPSRTASSLPGSPPDR